MAHETNITIVGAGLAGGLLACLLGRRGFRVNVYERRSDPRDRGIIGGRSINLALSTRGLTALKLAGLDDAVLKDAVAMRGRIMHDIDGKLSFQPYSNNPNDAINSVSRGDLNMTLLNAADALDNVTLHFDHRCTDVDLNLPAATFQREPQGDSIKVESDLIIGADGAFSIVRNSIMKLDRFDYSQMYLDHGYKELTIPPTESGDFAMEPHALHIWPRGGFMMIALPNRDKSFTCTCFWPLSGSNSFDRLQSPDQIAAFFSEHFPDAIQYIPKLIEDFQNNPASSLAIIRCKPWHVQDKVLLIGDAAHAIVPFYGQGINAGFEDCRVLVELIDEQLGKSKSRPSPNPSLEGRGMEHVHATVDWSVVFDRFTTMRKKHADAIADLALSNFIEMRDRVGSPWFRLGKKLEKTVHRLLPRWFTPLYNMITFSNVPYADARRKAKRQWRVLTSVTLIVVVMIVLLVIMII